MSDFASLIAYIVVFSLSALLLSFGIKHSIKFVRFLAIMIPILFIGLRSEVGTDYAAYVYMYNLFSTMTLPDYLALSENSIEIGYYALISISYFFIKEPWMMFLLASGLTIGIAYKAIKRLAPNNTALVFFLYLLVVLPFAMNGVRQGIAMSIVFFAINYIISGKFWKYLITVVIASLFHTSALLLLPAYFIRNIVLNKRYDSSMALAASAILSIAVGVMLPITVSLGSGIPLLGEYLEYEGRHIGVGLLDIAFRLIPVCIVLFTYSFVVKKNRDMRLIAAFVLLELAILGLGSVSAVFTRMTYYLSIAGLVYLAVFPSAINGARLRRLSKILVVVYASMLFIVTYYIVGYSDIFPYNSVFGI